NQQRWNFGVLCPDTYAKAQGGTELSSMRTECLIEADSATTVNVKVRFLHLMIREVGEVIANCEPPVPDCRHVSLHNQKYFVLVPSLEVDGKHLQMWQEAVEREVVVPQIRISEVNAPQKVSFEFPASRTIEEVKDASGREVGLLIRTQQELNGEIEVSIDKTNLQLL